jgi:hypothetical protein
MTNKTTTTKNAVDFSPQAKYTDRSIAVAGEFNTDFCG